MLCHKPTSSPHFINVCSHRFISHNKHKCTVRHFERENIFIPLLLQYIILCIDQLFCGWYNILDTDNLKERLIWLMVFGRLCLWLIRCKIETLWWRMVEQSCFVPGSQEAEQNSLDKRPGPDIIPKVTPPSPVPRSVLTNPQSGS